MNKPINKICLSVTLWTTLIIVMIALIAGFYIFLQNVHQAHSGNQRHLSTIGPLLINAISGELLLEDDRAINAIKREFIQNYQLAEIIISKELLECPIGSIFSEPCWASELQHLKPKYYLLITSNKKIPFSTINSFLLWTLIPLILMGAIISFMIRRKLINTIVNPIVALAENPEKWKPDTKGIAKEVEDVYGKLMCFINERDQEIQYAEELKREASIGKLAVQLAHDIRSPLVALDVAINHIEYLPESERILIRNAKNRIRDIANNLLSEYKKKRVMHEYQMEDVPIVDLTLNLISEKRMQYKNRATLIHADINKSAYGCFVNLPNNHFKRVLSNLLDNAFESINKIKGEIRVTLNEHKNDIIISIQDNGCGMSDELVAEIKNGNNCSSKKQGHGLGLSNTIKLFRDLWDREINIVSQVKVGTNIELRLPRTETPKWFANDIKIKQTQCIIIIDDDESIHQVWIKRFKHLSNVTFYHFYNYQNFFDYDKSKLQNVVYFIDYEFIQTKKNGLDIIEEFNISSASYLVSSRHEETQLRTRCENLGVKIIPKNYAPFIAIDLVNSQADIVLIDDNISLTDAWILQGEKVGKMVDAFNTINDFMNVLNQYPKTIPIYIDHDLKTQKTGLSFSKELHDLGFTNLYLMTGFPAENFTDAYWLKGIVGKKPSF